MPAGLPVQVEVKALGDPALARRTAAALCERDHAESGRLEVISFWSGACALAAAAGFRALLSLPSYAFSPGPARRSAPAAGV